VEAVEYSAFAEAFAETGVARAPGGT